MNPGSPLQTSAPCDLKKEKELKKVDGWIYLSYYRG